MYIMGEWYKYNKRTNVPAFQELQLIPTRTVLNDTEVEIKRPIETKHKIETLQTIETIQTTETKLTKKRCKRFHMYDETLMFEVEFRTKTLV